MDEVEWVVKIVSYEILDCLNWIESQPSDFREEIDQRYRKSVVKFFKQGVQGALAP
ncbi:hypothetical protein CWATWH0003_B104 [Crocosphaera watsonii WH 0003]|uniref:Uncharacterized protein n=2 Tax=Crocosphaera watsonii TaxID=263511 RepID=G5JEB7_CROWT|nr:hypothetical protein CWATWH0003_B104 [Crocosphaera watsonii WH 0003]CCQ56701.1 hypothetical protein CWATWH0005_112 [Crocosphaera watsonii WH 0005]